jgi:hypothetical protein
MHASITNEITRLASKARDNQQDQQNKNTRLFDVPMDCYVVG